MKSPFTKVCLLFAVLLITFGNTAYSDSTPDFEELNDKALQKIKKGLKYLAMKQDKDGGFGGGPRIAVTPLVGMAFMSHGHTPNEGKYAKQIKRAIKFLLKRTSKKGFISERGSRMYEHGFATLFLAEVYGMSRDEKTNKKIKDALTKSMGLLARAQCSLGGWNYTPVSSSRNDMSITVCQAMAMRASRAAGIKVSTETVKKLIKCMEMSAGKDGGFPYSAGRRGGSTYPVTAGGICICYAMGLYNNPKFKQILERGIQFLERGGRGKRSFRFFYYTTYYATHAMYQAGGKHWKEWFPKTRDHLLSSQRPDGSWTGGRGGVLYSTAIACVVLQIPYRYLPIVQR